VAYLKPNLFERTVFNKLAMRFGIGGTHTLLVPGRSSGRVQHVPVIPVEVDGVRYLVSTRGESNWVRNLRAAGRAELRSGGKTEPVRVTELSIEERAPVIEAYKRRVGKEVQRYFAKLPDPADHPIFRLDPA
jgi:deazaflavin-dependent oxidoreductase (nitroreductase family)